MFHTAFSTLSHFFAAYGYWAIFFGVMLENVGIPLPGETVLLFAGFLAYQGHLQLVPAILVAAAGATCGLMIGYGIGYAGGRPLIRKFLGRFAPAAKSFDHSEVLFLKFGHWAVFAGRFVAGLRVFVGILAGLFRMPFPRFLFFNVSGAIAWATAIATLGYVFGSRMQRLFEFLKRFDLYTLIAIGLAALVLVGVWAARRHRRPAESQTHSQ